MVERAPGSLPQGSFSIGDHVEVLSSDAGFSDAWAAATVVALNKDGFMVEYSKFVDGAGNKLREKVPLKRMRAVPLFQATLNPSPGLRVEGYLHDCWWPGEVVEYHGKNGTRVAFDDGDKAWLARRHVRPLLRRYGAVADAPQLPATRLPRRISPHEAVRVLATLLRGCDVESLCVNDVQASLERALLPSEEPGWLGPHRDAVVILLEHALHRTNHLPTRRHKRPPGGT